MFTFTNVLNRVKQVGGMGCESGGSANWKREDSSFTKDTSLRKAIKCAILPPQIVNDFFFNLFLSQLHSKVEGAGKRFCFQVSWHEVEQRF